MAGAAVALPALFSAPVALAQVDTSGWQCQFCPFPQDYEAEVEVGASSVSDDALTLW